MSNETTHMGGSKLCLNMIVKDEMANLQRCLDSAAPHIACWVICDTGSSDGTQDYIRSYFAARNIPGELHGFAFVDFAQARNEALARARASTLRFDYLLLTDADMELTVNDPAFAVDLNSAAYNVIQHSGISYWNVRLLRRDAEASYRGVTHEFLDVRSGETANLRGVGFIDHASGANRVGKFERDLRLLKAALASEHDPGMVARYTFYLANTLRDSGQSRAALEAYLQRARLGHWPQEIFVSLFNAASLQEGLGYSDDAVIAAYAEATAACPARAEALHGAARFCRNKGLYQRGYEFAAQGLAIARPEDALFSADWIYDYGLLDEFAVNAYWTARYTECLSACDRLLKEGRLPADERARVTENRSFSVGKLRQALEASTLEAENFARLIEVARRAEELGRPDDVVLAAYTEAIDADAARSEALHGAARFCRRKGLHDRGYQFALRGLALPRPKDAPIAESWIYEYGLLDEFAVNAYWTERYGECASACDRLLSEGRLAADERDRVMNNRQFAIEKIAAAKQDAAIGRKSVREIGSLGAPPHSADAEPGPPPREMPAARSFDLFDTLLARRCVHPREVFNEVERASGRVGFAEARRAAEAAVSAGEYTLDDIYRRLTDSHGFSTDEAEHLKRLELEAEAANLFPIVENCRDVGAGDVVVSDMYLPREWLAAILEAKSGVSAAVLYASSNGKRSGAVWKVIQRTRTLTEHVGDDLVTDLASARNAGIPARLTTVARRSEVEQELADNGFAPLANLIREARLTTWSDDPTRRDAQIAQTQLNFPLLFLTTLHLANLAAVHPWRHVLMSGRDCYLWHKLYLRVRRLLQAPPTAVYFHTSRVVRAHPSPSYIAYFAAQRTGERNVVVDLCGTGWSLGRLVARAPWPIVDILLFHRLKIPDLVRDYEKFGRSAAGVGVHSIVSREPIDYDSEVLERMNFAPDAAVEDVRATPEGFRPVRSSLDYPEELAELIGVHHAAFDHACELLPTLRAVDTTTMQEGEILTAIEAIYRRLAGLLPRFEMFGAYKLEEERLAREALRKAYEASLRETVPLERAATKSAGGIAVENA